MRISEVEVRPGSLRLFWIAALAAVAGTILLLVQPFQTADGKTAVVTYSRGVLHVSIPYHAERAGGGKLTVEVLDPEDKVLGRAETQAAIGEGYGRWQEDIRLDKALGVDDLVWHRVRYRYEYDGGKATAIEGTESISQILRTPVVHILGQQAYLSGGPAAVRGILTGSKNEPVPRARAGGPELLVGGQEPRGPFSWRLQHPGTA